MEDYCSVLTVDGKSSCVVCSDKWMERKPKRHSTGTLSYPLISTFSFLTRLGNRISLNMCDLHSHNANSHVTPTDYSLLVGNVVDMKVNTFTEVNN